MPGSPRAGGLRMIKTQDMHRTLQYLILGADLAWIVTCLSTTQLHYADQQQTLWSFVRNPAVITASAVWIALYIRKGLAGFRQGWYPPTMVAQVIVAITYLLVSLCALAIVLHHHYSLGSALLLALLLAAGFIVNRYIAHWLIDSHLHRRAKRRVIILGSGRMVRELVHKIGRHPELCMEVAGVLFPSDGERWEEHVDSSSHTVSLRTLNILDRLQHENAHELILVEPIPPGSETEQLLSSCREAGLKIHLLPQQYELYLSKARLMEIEDVPLLSLQEQRLSAVSVQVKRLVDFVGAAGLVILSSPLLLASALLLQCSKGTALRTERRCGQDGSAFEMYRLNITRDQDNVNAFERFLVQFSFTEFPQLFNVLKGEMSLVGPRPEAPERVKHYSMWQRQRLTVKPGLTGLAQVHGFREQHSSEEKAHFDLQYIFHWSLFLDLCLILQTGWTLLQRIVREHRMVIPSLLAPLPTVNFELGRICDADSTQSGTD
jgi:lipopolysaccharide/colanic/teichoic acid biosynthesis glycosyltransferase